MLHEGHVVPFARAPLHALHMLSRHASADGGAAHCWGCEVPRALQVSIRGILQRAATSTTAARAYLSSGAHQHIRENRAAPALLA